MHVIHSPDTSEKILNALRKIMWPLIITFIVLLVMCVANWSYQEYQIDREKKASELYMQIKDISSQDHTAQKNHLLSITNTYPDTLYSVFSFMQLAKLAHKENKLALASHYLDKASETCNTTELRDLIRYRNAIISIKEDPKKSSDLFADLIQRVDEPNAILTRLYFAEALINANEHANAKKQLEIAQAKYYREQLTNLFELHKLRTLQSRSSAFTN